MWLLLQACTGQAPDLPTLPDPPEGPSLLDVDPVVPLTRVVTLHRAHPVTVTATWQLGERTFTARAGPGTDPELTLVGFPPDATVPVEVRLSAPGLTDEVEELLVETDPLPAPFPELTVHRSDPAAMAPGDTLLGVATDGTWYGLVLDPDGQVLWLHEQPGARIWDVHQDDSGLLRGVVFGAGGGLLTFDWRGRTIQWIAPVHGAGWHHSFAQIPGGHLALAHEVVTFPSYPASYQDPEAEQLDVGVLVDHVVELDDDGAVVHDIDLSEIVPHDRIGYRSLVTEFDGIDWTHANSAELAPDGETLIVSLRHQDAVLALDRATGALRWILANPANWPPELDALRLQPTTPDFVWPYHQHAVEPQPDGLLLLFDNGAERASPWTDDEPLGPSERWSRVLAVRVDEAAGTVAPVWSFTIHDVQLDAGAMGDVDLLPDGNVLSVWGYVVHEDGLSLDETGRGRTLGRIVEFAPQTGAVAFDVALWSDVDEVPAGWNVYRAQRIGSLGVIPDPMTDDLTLICTKT
ncbi:MAG: aryl-sulfate sulfotransferase [Myxococcota bacterium]